jgi:hypothetical protein
MRKTIEIIVSPTGESRVETKGYAGVECKAASQFLEQALGKKTGEQCTPEFHLQRQAAETTTCRR